MFKVFNKVKILFTKIKYKLIYGKRIVFGKNVRFRKRFSIVIEKNGKLIIGDNCFFNNDCSINCINEIKIGSDSIFGEGVKIYDHNHVFNKSGLIKSQGFSTGKIVIGKNCWLGSNVVILKNTSIGDDCVIGAGVVFNEHLERGMIVKKSGDYYIEKIYDRLSN